MAAKVQQRTPPARAAAATPRKGQEAAPPRRAATGRQGREERAPAVPQKGQSQDLALLRGGSQLPTALQERMKADSGLGLSQQQEDNLVPMITILQDNSPQVKDNDSKYIEGAEPGMIWLKNLDQPFVPGEDGILVQSCHFDKGWTEWMPRGQGGGGGAGFVARYDFDKCPEDIKKVPDPNNPKRILNIRPNGNQVVETRYHVVRVWLEDGRKVPFVLPLAGSGHSFSKAWMFAMNNIPDGGGGVAPAWSKVWRLTLITRSNPQGTWFMFGHEDAGWVEDVADYEAGAQLFNAFNTGEARMDDRQMGDAVGSEGGSGSTM